MPTDSTALPPIAILGAGSMGGAILHGLVRSGLATGGVTVTNRTRAKAAALAGLDGVTSIALEDRARRQRRGRGIRRRRAHRRQAGHGARSAARDRPAPAPGRDRGEPRRRRHDRDVRVDPRRRTSRCCARCRTRPPSSARRVTGLAPDARGVRRRRRRRARACSRPSAPSSRCPSRRSTPLSTISGSGPAYFFLAGGGVHQGGDRQGLHAGRGAADGRADLHRRGGAARGIRGGARRAAPPRHEPEGHDRARDRRAAGGAPRRGVREGDGCRARAPGSSRPVPDSTGPRRL